MEVLDTSIANVALLHIAGGLGGQRRRKHLGPDQLPGRQRRSSCRSAAGCPRSIGRKRFYMTVRRAVHRQLRCSAGWRRTSTLLIVFRVLQGLGGGGLAPSEQSMLADTFPAVASAAQAFALYGVAVIVAPTLGPTLGGCITDNASWHWIFFINVPVGAAVARAGRSHRVDEPPALQRERAGAVAAAACSIDWIGFVLVAALRSAASRSSSTRGRRTTGSVRRSSSSSRWSPALSFARVRSRGS